MQDPVLLDEIDQVIYIADVETHELLFVNRKGRKTLGCGTEYRGKKCYRVLQGLEDVCPFCKNQWLTEHRETCQWDHYNEKLGTHYQLQDRLISFQGRRARIEIAIDVSEREERQRELKNALAEQRLLTGCVRTLNGSGSPDQRADRALADIGAYYKADRAYLFRLSGDGQSLNNTHEWCNTGITPQIEVLQGVDARYMDRWRPAFSRGEAVVEPDIEAIRAAYPDEYEIMSRQGIRCYMEAPLFLDGTLAGFWGIDNPDPAMIANSSATMLTIAYSISSAQARDAANARLRDTQRRYQTTVEGADIGIWEYQVKQHRIVNANRKFVDAGFPEVLEHVPDCLYDFFRSEDRPKLQKLYQDIERGEERLEGDFWLRWNPSSEFRCERMSYFVARDASGQPDIAYGISLDITAERREQERYERTIRDMTTAMPNAVGILRFNLTKNSYTAVSQEHNFFGIGRPAGSWDRLALQLAQNIPDPKERQAFLTLGSAPLLEGFRRGIGHAQQDYFYTGSDGRPHWVSTRVQMVLNPDTSDVEGIAYSLDLSREKLQNEIFEIITNRSFDLVAMIHLASGTFEAVFLGDSFPAAYRRLLPGRGAVCSFQEYCREALLHMDAETAADYTARLSPDYMRAKLESGGSYEFTLKEYFPEQKRGFMYRKFQHYRLGGDRDTVLVIESDETEAALRQEEKLRQAKDEAEHDCMIMDSLMGGIAVLKMPGKKRLSVDYFNSYVFQMLGYDPADMPQRAEKAVGTPAESLFSDALTFVHPEDKEYVRQMFADHYDSKSFALRPYRMFGKDQKCYWILERVRTGLSPEGQRIFYAAFHDVSEEIALQQTVTRQLEVEQQLRRRADQANAAKSDFLSRMSHDMRTPLNGVIGMAYLASEQDNPPYTAQCLSKINTSAKFLLGLINNILDMSKVESGRIEFHPEPYPFREFNDYLSAVIRPLCEEKNQRFVLQPDVTFSSVPLADKNYLNQILFNLLSNAVKYTPEGGTITYRIRGRQIGEARAEVEHRITDTGIGISWEFQERLFEPFSQEGRDDVSEQRGSGLGLSIVKKLVDLMGGTISVQSQIGRGTTFTVTLAFDTVPAGQTAAQNAAEGPRQTAGLDGRHVLLCEDHPLNQEIARALLTEKGLLVDLAENGEAGVRRFAASPPRYYDAILMDIRMPVMDGCEAARAIRALDRPDAGSVPIIAMTADAFEESVRTARAAGMDGYVTKPIEPEKLYQTLQTALSNRKEE